MSFGKIFTQRDAVSNVFPIQTHFRKDISVLDIDVHWIDAIRTTLVVIIIIGFDVSTKGLVFETRPGTCVLFNIVIVVYKYLVNIITLLVQYVKTVCKQLHNFSCIIFIGVFDIPFLFVHISSRFRLVIGKHFGHETIVRDFFQNVFVISKRVTYKNIIIHRKHFRTFVSFRYGRSTDYQQLRYTPGDALSQLIGCVQCQFGPDHFLLLMKVVGGRRH
mmetsp:Transcript_26010/g.39318  ORF Transcript_26010/g.39318 Transcript_26010/m.39318 type:complete len:218 (-) Transcript_26010:834-1487(-)